MADFKTLDVPTLISRKNFSNFHTVYTKYPKRKKCNIFFHLFAGCAISSMVAVKRSPTVAPSVVPRLLAKSAAAAEIVAASSEGCGEVAVCSGGTVVESPSKRKLRMSVSCDNYLGDGKFSLCRRDSVGSGSPHSSKV